MIKKKIELLQGIGLAKSGKNINIMTNSDIIEEILFKSHSLHIQNEVMGYAETIMNEYPKMAKVDAYQKAFYELSKD